MTVRVQSILEGGGTVVEGQSDPKVVTGKEVEDDLVRDIRSLSTEINRAKMRSELVKHLLGSESPAHSPGPQLDGMAQMATIVTSVLGVMKDMPTALQAQYSAEVAGLRERLDELKGTQPDPKSPIEAYREVQGLLDDILAKVQANQPKPMAAPQPSDLPVLLELKKVELQSSQEIVKFQAKLDEDHRKWDEEREERRQQWTSEQEDKHRRWKIEDDERARGREMELTRMAQQGLTQKKAVDVVTDLVGSIIDGLPEGGGVAAKPAGAPRPTVVEGKVTGRRVAIRCRDCGERIELPQEEAQPGAKLTCPNEQCRTEYELVPATEEQAAQ